MSARHYTRTEYSKLTVGDEAPKVTSNNAMPGGTLPGIELERVSAIDEGEIGKADASGPLS